MKTFTRIFLLSIVGIFSYKALLGTCVWYREKFNDLELPSQTLKDSTDDILMGLVVFITVLLSSQIGRRRCK
jgi:hypothetical protein